MNPSNHVGSSNNQKHLEETISPSIHISLPLCFLCEVGGITLCAKRAKEKHAIKNHQCCAFIISSQVKTRKSQLT